MIFLKKLIYNYSFYYLGILAIIFFASLFNLLGLFSSFFNHLIIFIILNLYYFIIGFKITKKEAIKHYLILSIPIFLINYLISLLINPSINAITFFLINYLFYILGIFFKKKANH